MTIDIDLGEALVILSMLSKKPDVGGFDVKPDEKIDVV